MRTFFKFLLAREKIAKDPMTKISVLKTKKRLPGFVREEDMVNLLDKNIFPKTFEGARDRLILEMFYGTGIRLSELIFLKERFVDLRKRTIKVLGKRNKERVIPFSAGLVPIIEPEIDIHCPEKAHAEALLQTYILEKLNQLPAGQCVMLKLTLPEQDDFYADCVRHPKVLRVVALSGGYTRQVANDRLRRNHGVVASFSRALVEGLTAQQSDAEFNALLDESIQNIFEASNT